MYDQNYDGISGINYPENGEILYQDDFTEEQSGIAEEILTRENDFFTRGIIEGFDVTVSATTGCVDIAAGRGRDMLGRRISHAGITAFPLPDLQTVKLVVRHVWTYEEYIPDGSAATKTRRRHSAEIAYIADGADPTDRERLLFRVQRSGASISVLADLRSYSVLRGNVLTGLDARYLESLGHENLVYNPHQQYILCDTPGNPDGYIFSCDGTAPAIVEDGDGSVRITVPSDATMMTYSQKVDEVPGLLARLRGKQVSFRVVLKTAAAGAEVVVDDGVGTTVQAVAGTGSEEIITITRSIDATATMVKIMVRKASAGGTINIYRMEGNVGFRAVPGLPCVVKTIIGEYRSLPRAKVPVGQLHRNGASLSTTTYSRLFSVIKYEYGGSGGNFNVPDFRGWFERGWANGQATDPDRASRTDRGDGTTGDAVGTAELDALQGFWIVVANETTKHLVVQVPNQGTSGGGGSTNVSLPVWAKTAGGYDASVGIPGNDGVNGDIRKSSESRAKNKNVLMTIVYA